jgi:hypothetical protein
VIKGGEAGKGRKLNEGKKGIIRRDGKEKKEYETMTVQRGQGIAFTNDLPHGNKENNTKKEVYPLFAYIVSNSGDFSLGSVFPLNKGNKEKLKIATEVKVCCL